MAIRGVEYELAPGDALSSGRAGGTTEGVGEESNRGGHYFSNGPKKDS